MKKLCSLIWLLLISFVITACAQDSSSSLSSISALPEKTKTSIEEKPTDDPITNNSTTQETSIEDSAQTEEGTQATINTVPSSHVGTWSIQFKDNSTETGTLTLDVTSDGYVTYSEKNNNTLVETETQRYTLVSGLEYLMEADGPWFFYYDKYADVLWTSLDQILPFSRVDTGTCLAIDWDTTSGENKMLSYHLLNKDGMVLCEHSNNGSTTYITYNENGEIQTEYTCLSGKELSQKTEYSYLNNNVTGISTDLESGDVVMVIENTMTDCLENGNHQYQKFKVYYTDPSTENTPFDFDHYYDENQKKILSIRNYSNGDRYITRYYYTPEGQQSEYYAFLESNGKILSSYYGCNKYDVAGKLIESTFFSCETVDIDRLDMNAFLFFDDYCKTLISETTISQSMTREYYEYYDFLI